MLRVKCNYPKGSDGWTKDVLMPVIPRVGESINFSTDDGSDEYEVKYVVHYPNDPDMDVYIVLKVARF